MKKKRRATLELKQQRSKSKRVSASTYGKKALFLKKNGGFGFDYPSKPWKEKR